MHVFFAVLWHIIQFYRLIIIQKDTQSKTENQRKPPRAQRDRSLRKEPRQRDRSLRKEPPL